MGVFPAPTIMEATLKRDFGVKLVGRTAEVRERFYAISMEAKIQHPAVVAICDAARKSLAS